MVSYPKANHQIWDHRFSPMFSSINFSFVFLHLEFFCVCVYKVWVSRMPFLHMGVQFIQHHLLNCLSVFDKTIVWIYLWAFYFAPLTYVSILSPIPHYLDSYILRISLDIRSYKSFCFVFLFQDQHFKINMSISAKEAAGVLIEIVLSLWINLGSIAILTTSSQIHPHEMFSTYLEL